MSTRDEAERIAAIEAILGDWLADTRTVIACGDFSRGCISELVPHGSGRLSAAKYDGPFRGLRDIVIPGQRHHLHLDLLRFARVRYVVEASVCFAWKPAFGVRLSDASGAERLLEPFVGHPYRRGSLDLPVVEAYFGRMRSHQTGFPDLVEAVIVNDRRRETAGVWDEVAALATQRPRTVAPRPVSMRRGEESPWPSC